MFDVRVCACVCVRVRACVRVRVCVCVRAHNYISNSAILKHIDPSRTLLLVLKQGSNHNPKPQYLISQIQIFIQTQKVKASKWQALTSVSKVRQNVATL